MSKIVLAAVAAAVLAGPAFAETESTLVRTSRVDFSDRAQVQKVYDRVVAAANRVCTTPSDNKYVARPDRECVDRAVAQAIAQTNKPLLTQAYNAAGEPSNRALAGNDQ